MGKGGILADDMGLGKTMQCSAFLAGALAASRSSSIFNPKQAPAASAAAGSQSAAPVPVRALIVAPKTLLAHWEKELRVCGMGCATHSFYSSSEGERASVLTTITRQGLRLAVLRPTWQLQQVMLGWDRPSGVVAAVAAATPHFVVFCASTWVKSQQQQVMIQEASAFMQAVWQVKINKRHVTGVAAATP